MSVSGVRRFGRGGWQRCWGRDTSAAIKHARKAAMSTWTA